MKYDIAVVGAGPAGIMAAICAAKKDVKVALIEKNDIIGRKILSTGNGRCNFTNSDMDISHFHSESIDYVKDVLSLFSNEKLLEFMKDIGIYPAEKNGYYYPYTNSAADVRNVLDMYVKDIYNITVHTDFTVDSIKYKNKSFIINKSSDESITSKACILATGGKAMPVSGSDGFGINVAEELGHDIQRPVSSLVALKSKDKFFKKLKGIRLKAKITLYIDEIETASDTGEIQLTDYGVSGIPTFNISGFANRALLNKKKTYVSLNFFPDMPKEFLYKELEKRIYEKGYNKTISEVFTGLLDKRLVNVILNFCHISNAGYASELKEGEFKRFFSAVYDFRTEIVDSLGWDKAQTTSGGIKLSQLKPQNLESSIIDGLFFCGEMTDVDGDCGGYNLQWAFSSGYVAGNGALDYVED